MNRFTELVGCRRPLQLAGMGWVAGPELCAAVSRAGGLGMTALPMLPAADLEVALGKLAPACDAPFGLNILVPFLDPAALEVAARRSPVVEFFYGDPDADLVARARPATVLWQIGSVDEARAAVDAGADAVIAQGTEAGGHVRGTVSLLPLLDGVLAAVDVPVIAAGGLSSPRAVAAARAAGADAVRIGTAFLAAAEADIHPDYVAAVLAATGRDTVLTTAFGVMWPDAPHRVLRSSVERATALDRDTVGTVSLGGHPFPVPRLGPQAATRTFVGDVAATPLYAGEGVGAVRRVRPAAENMDDLLGSVGAETN
jgi:nitronate monooxygenase